MMKGCQKRKANLEAKLQKVAHALETRKDDAWTSASWVSTTSTWTRATNSRT